MAQLIQPAKGHTGLQVQQQGRNAKCRCGSGKKAKNCCGTKTDYMSREQLVISDIEAQKRKEDNL